jgi:hypothetical protein
VLLSGVQLPYNCLSGVVRTGIFEMFRRRDNILEFLCGNSQYTPIETEGIDSLDFIPYASLFIKVMTKKLSAIGYRLFVSSLTYP